VKQSGHALVTLSHHKNETYLVPLPDMRIYGLLSSAPYPEINGTYTIPSSSGYCASITFSSGSKWSPFSSSQRNQFTASVYHTSSPAKILYTSKGSWSDTFTMSDSRGTIIETYSCSDPKTSPVVPTITPLASQSPWESRRAWSAVISALRKNDFPLLVSEKSKLEKAQREMRKRERSEGRTWNPAYFKTCDLSLNDKQFAALANHLSETEVRRLIGTNGCWRLDKARSPKQKSSWPQTPYG